MTDALAVELVDTELHEEIELLSALMVAARGVDQPLRQDAVDEILRHQEAVTSR